MSQHTEDQYKSPEQLQREIDDTRSQLDYTVNALRDRLSPGEVLDQALEYWRHGPKSYASELGTNLSHSVRDNPLAVGLVGIGLSWLMMGRAPASRASWADSVDDEYVEMETELSERRVYVPGQTEAEVHTQDTGDSKWQSAKDKAAAGAERLRGKSSEAQRRARDSMRRAGRSVSDTTASAVAKGRRYRAQAGYRAAQARDGAVDLFHEHPLVVGALGIAAGALIAAAIPPSRREDELMGETRDDLADRARAAAEHGAEVAQRAAQSAGEAARREAERQGLSPEAAEQAFREAAEKAGHVAHAAGDAAMDEINRGDGAGSGSPYSHH